MLEERFGRPAADHEVLRDVADEVSTKSPRAGQAPDG
jgi:hypothetical protein